MDRTERLRALHQQAPSGARRDADAADAMLALALYMALSDGSIDDDEYDALLAMYATVLGDEADEVTLDELIEDGNEALESEGLDACLAAAAEQLPTTELRRAAFDWCASMAAVDGELDADERALFERLADALQISREESLAMLATWQEKLA